MVQPGTEKALLAREGHLPPRPVPLSGRIPPVMVRMIFGALPICVASDAILPMPCWEPVRTQGRGSELKCTWIPDHLGLG